MVACRTIYTGRCQALGGNAVAGANVHTSGGFAYDFVGGCLIYGLGVFLFGVGLRVIFRFL